MPNVDTPRVAFRTGLSLLLELEARGDSIHQVAKTMCERYLEMVADPNPINLDLARQLYNAPCPVTGGWIAARLAATGADGGYGLNNAERMAYVDALERAHLLVQREGLSVERALRTVGLTNG